MDIQENLLTINEMTRSGQQLKNINSVVVHFVDIPSTTAMFNRNYFESFSRKRNNYASCHYIIGLEGEIVRCVPEDEVTYHVEKIEVNFETLSIFCCFENDKLNEATYESLVELLKDICVRFDLDPNNDILRHYDISQNRCPIYFVNNVLEWEILKQRVCSINNYEEFESAYIPGRYMVNTSNSVNVRENANVNSSKINSVYKNDVIPIYETINKWGRTTNGWVPMTRLELLDNDGGKDYRITSLNGLKCRKEPDINSEKITMYIYNTILTIYEIKKNWGKTKDGWVMMCYLVPIKTIGENYIVISTFGLNIRGAPSISSQIVGCFKYNQTITVYETSNGWGRTSQGWVSIEYLEKL